jgi:hypothetical protein
MPSRFFDKNNSEVSQKDVENRPFWYEHGEAKELAFVEKFKALNFKINPEKRENVAAVDLLDANGNLCDLKVQNTPFFVSARYDVDPQFAVTFNKKDLIRYSIEYPKIDIVYWVEWQIVKAIFGTSSQEIVRKVEPMSGVWKISLGDIATLCDDKKNLHSYLKRVNDKSNATNSYVINLQHRHFQKIA